MIKQNHYIIDQMLLHINKGILDIKTGDYSSATAKLKGNGL